MVSFDRNYCAPIQVLFQTNKAHISAENDCAVYLE